MPNVKQSSTVSLEVVVKGSICHLLAFSLVVGGLKLSLIK